MIPVDPATTAPVAPVTPAARTKPSLIRRVGKAAFSPVGVVLLGAVCYTDYRRRKGEKLAKLEGDKKVLVLPFHRMKIVETKTPSAMSTYSALTPSEEKLVEIEVKELVELIHGAASDSNVVALYGIFGHGFQFSSGGSGHLEEIRNALKVFRESHRVHKEPNTSHDEVLLKNGHGSPKPAYAFADTFSNPGDPSNAEYYLASAFSHIHLQKQGEVALFGAAKSQFFLRQFLEDNGIKIDVFKRGKYKNAPNTFTDKYFSRDHKENVANIVQSLDEMECEKIAESRGLKGFNKTMWKKLRTQGSFTASQAHDLGLIDYMPSLDPLTDLVDSNKDAESKTQMKQKWGKDTDMDRFSATRMVSIAEYADLMAKRKNSLVFGNDFAKDVAEMKQEFIQMAKDAIGWTTDADKDASRREKVAILRVDGLINDKIADKTVKALRKIKKDNSIKCVVLRVNSPGGSITASERVLQECKDIPQPLICSMSNVCASGGYYIATGCDRIFCMPNTVTGSIGVFGMRVDMTDLAKKYGVKVQHVGVGPHSTTFSAFQPLTKPIQLNFTRYVDSSYDHFKSLVAESRGLPMGEVERLAQGRVWTGEQAKLVGLVDELGGLSRAVAYAERTYTSGNAAVEVWPKRITFTEMFLSDASPSTFAAFLGHLWGGAREPYNFEITNRQTVRLLVSSLLESPSSCNSLNGFMMTMDENTALNCMAQDYACKHKIYMTDDFPMEFWR